MSREHKKDITNCLSLLLKFLMQKVDIQISYLTKKKASELVKIFIRCRNVFFKQYTNKSRYADTVFDKLVPTLDLSEIENLIALHPNAKNRNRAIDQAVSMVKTMNDIERLIQFNNTHGDQLEGNRRRYNSCRYLYS
ncbi:MAG: hypothetical protein IPN86_21050 [Saprospiraceae bacterium]|nr:hypothetical protein [Saprospiraceae bacterium]